MAIDTVFCNIDSTHGVIPLTCWDGPHFFIKELDTARIFCKTKKLEDIRKAFEDNFGNIWKAPEAIEEADPVPILPKKPTSIWDE